MAWSQNRRRGATADANRLAHPGVGPAAAASIGAGKLASRPVQGRAPAMGGGVAHAGDNRKTRRNDPPSANREIFTGGLQSEKIKLMTDWLAEP